MKALTLAFRLLRRDWRAGELRLLAVAIVIAVGSVTAVGFFTDRIERAMTRQAGEVLAADLAVEWSAPIPEAIAEEARAKDLRTARTIDFPSVVLANERTQLVQVKGISPEYPLRGSLRVADDIGGTETTAETIPAAGEAWVEARLLVLLGLGIGDELGLGELRLRISRVLTYEPDRAANLFRLAPRVMIAFQDVERSGLLGPASRVRYRLLAAGDAAQVEAFRRWSEKELPTGAKLDDVREARPEIRNALDRGGRFLRLTAVTATLLCIVAVALATRRFVERQADASALLRCLGASRRLVTLIFALRMLMLGLGASLVGTLLGLSAQPVLANLVGHWFSESLPTPSLLPMATGIATGILVLAGFALPSVVRLGAVPPLRVFRRHLGAAPVGYLFFIGAAVLALGVLLISQLGDDALAGRLIGGLGGAVALLLLVARYLVRVLAPLRQRTSGSWRYGLASLSRNPATTAMQLTGFGLGITALLLLAMVRVDLLAAWQRNLAPDTPNHFLINIQPDEVQELGRLLREEGLITSGPYPMMRGRLVGIGERKVTPEDYEDPRAQRLAEREFNLSWSVDMQPDNRILAGRWWDAEAARSSSEFSVEDGLAKTLGIELGDTLTFEIAGERVSAQVTSLRSVQWDSFNANFFVIGSPALMTDRPATYITAFHLPPDRLDVILEIVQRFPSVTPLDVTALMTQVRGIMDRGALAVEFVFGFTLLAGVVVLVAGIQTSRELRVQEAVVLRTLGLQRRRLLSAIAIEFSVLGALAGTIAAAAATATSYALATAVFELPWHFNGAMWLIAIIGGAIGVALAGIAATWRLTREPPIVVLREA